MARCYEVMPRFSSLLVCLIVLNQSRPFLFYAYGLWTFLSVLKIKDLMKYYHHTTAVYAFCIMLLLDNENTFLSVFPRVFPIIQMFIQQILSLSSLILIFALCLIFEVGSLWQIKYSWNPTKKCCAVNIPFRNRIRFCLLEMRRETLVELWGNLVCGLITET